MQNQAAAQTSNTLINSYKVAAETVNKTKQIVLLYDAAIRFVQQAREAIEAGNIEERYNLLQKAGNIIMGLHTAVDFEKGGDIAHILNNFYTSIDLRLLSINHRNDPAMCDQVVKELKLMRSAWNEIDQKFGAASSSGGNPDESSAVSA